MDYACEVEIAFPTPQHAEQVKKVMEVDKELGDKVTKLFRLHEDDDGLLRVLQMYVDCDSFFCLF